MAHERSRLFHAEKGACKIQRLKDRRMQDRISRPVQDNMARFRVKGHGKGPEVLLYSQEPGFIDGGQTETARVETVVAAVLRVVDVVEDLKHHGE